LQLTELVVTNRIGVDFDFNILTALKGWVGQAAKRTGTLQPLYGYRPYENIKKIKNIWHGA